MKLIKTLVVLSAFFFTAQAQAAHVSCSNVAAAVEALAELKMDSRSKIEQKQALSELRRLLTPEEVGVVMYIYNNMTNDSVNQTSTNELKELCTVLTESEV